MGILIGGEELHNNHHTYPNSAKLSVKPWEFDIGWFLDPHVRARRPGQAPLDGPGGGAVAGKAHIDMDTVWRC